MDPEAFCYWLKGYLDTHVQLDREARAKICEQLEDTIERTERKPRSTEVEVLLENSTWDDG